VGAPFGASRHRRLDPGFYLSLIRAGALPRLLSAFGLLTVAAHFVAIPLPGFLGLRAVVEAGMPMALSHVATAAWLVAKGLGPALPAARA